MTSTESDLLAALRDLEAAVAEMKTRVPKPDLLGLFARIDALTAALGPAANGELLHYLHKRSYEKARVYLEGDVNQIEKGGCDRRSRAV